MQVKRESFFRCVFSSPRSRRVAHVRAWDADEAVALFRTELRADGVEERGAIEVSAFDGTDVGEPTDYRP
jgi:hypothetical protein